ncbi:hypothetical protein FRB97_009732 [Tulasnella sp. 331]|nr:hypothetical protein FRB97_009732 [Tulasnella sp. 331]
MASMHDDSDDEKTLAKAKQSSPDDGKSRAPAKTANLTLDQGTDKIRYRRKWYQLHLPRDPPPPPPATLEDATETPLARANILSMLTYTWITPMITLGYQRPLQAPDLWKLDVSRQVGLMSKKLDEAWERRCEEAEEWNAKLDSGEMKAPVTKRIKWTVQSMGRKDAYDSCEKRWRDKDGRREPSLAWALNDVLGRSFWAGGLFKVIGDTAQLMGPLVSKEIIKFAQTRASGHSHSNIGEGVGLAIALFVMTMTTSICQHQFFWRSMQTGVLARAALISSLYKRGLTLTPKSRTRHSNAALMNHMSTDISRVDFAAQWFHAVWTAPIQVSICLALLIVQLGPSALAGFFIFVILTPLQKWMMGLQFKVRSQSMKSTDARSSLLQELLGGMRIIKYFCYERPFLSRIETIRRRELEGIWWILVIKAVNQAIAFSVPALALSATTDARSAFGRLTPVWKALTFGASVEGTASSTIHVDPSAPYAIHIKNADFQWEEPPPPPPSTKKRKHHKAAIEASAPSTPPTQEPFSIRDISISIPKTDGDGEGQVWAVVGPVGGGKSSLLQAMIGEMRQTRGDEKVVFGGKVAYCAQVAWIQNASVRENIIFGADWDEDRYWRAIRDAALLMDLEILPDGDLTEIGEKGINLSGGQKQRVNIARALYADADIVIMDDPLSAVDAHVGEALFTNAILSACRSQGKTVILVTHALHFLPQVDYILHVVSGRIVEQGTYQELINANGGKGAFARLLNEFSSGVREAKDEGDVEEGMDEIEVQAAMKVKAATKMSVAEVKRKVDEKTRGKAAGTGKIEGRLMKVEKRSIGSIKGSVYSTYIKAGRGWWTMPLIIITAILMQVTQVINSYWLIWWQANTFSQSSAFYMGLYAALVSLRLSLNPTDGNLRSLLYGHFSESLGGLTTIRAYGGISRFLRDNEYFTDLENRALFLTITNQRWLAIRLDFMGSMMVFVVALMAAAGANGISPSQVGLALTYCMSLSAMFGAVTRQSAEVENNMNAVERVVHYTQDDLIEQEAAYELPETKPAEDWPRGGSLQFRDVVMKYRPNLPPVLHDISLDVRAGEKIGVVGRTGAGKSSLMIALYRIVELSGGSIWLDGVDISTLGLFELRSKISIIPQDPLLFSGTIRSNLDPFSRFDDAKLYDALRRSHLVTAPPSTTRSSTESDVKGVGMKGSAPNRFTLETPIEPEGANLSVGERSLLSLARALVRDDIKLVVMDEATASVDMETDAAIQQTISREFGGKTLLCIAHRLRTIIHYDRVLVLEQGRVAEFDTPLKLFRQDGGIFRSLCEQSKISEEELIK